MSQMTENLENSSFSTNQEFDWDMQNQYYFLFFTYIKKTWALCRHCVISYYDKEGLKVIGI